MSALAWTAPWLAAAAVPAGVAVLWIARRGLGRGRPVLAWTAAAARGAVVTLAMLAAAGPHTTTTTQTAGAVLVAASGADAYEGADRVIRYAARAVGSAPIGGPDPAAASAPDAASAIESLRAAAPATAPSSIVLAWSPAASTPPDLGAAPALTRRGAETGILRPRGASAPPPVTPAPHLVLPASAAEGVEFSVVIDAGDAPFAGGSATWSVDGSDVGMPLPAGARRVSTPPVAVRAGWHVLTARFADRPPAAAAIRVAEPPGVLLVSAAGVEPPLASRLRAQGLRTTVVSETTCDLAPAVDVVVLGPGTGARCADDVASRVAAGTGLLVMGGDGPRSLARLRGTPLEALLPVEIPPRSPDEPPPPRPPDPPPRKDPDRPTPVIDEADRQALRVALLLCIDRSGSMTGVKIAMAREAAIAAARTLSPDDRVGVIAFDEETDWIAPFQDARDIARLIRGVQNLRADGGTNFYPALKLGIAAIAAEPCGVRHVVLLTDGATRAAVFRDIVESGAAQGVTLSAVAIGDGADLRLLGLLAQWGRGRLYPATEPERLPQVITLDAKRFVHAPRDAKKNQVEAPDVPLPPETAQEPEPDPQAPPTKPEPPRGPAPRAPRVALLAPFLAGIEAAPWPALPHPEIVRARGAATAPLVFDDDAPAMVLGRASAGRCAVVAADAFSPDARALWTWPEGGRAMAQLVRSLAPPRPPADDAPDVRFMALADGRGAAVVSVPGGGLLRLRPAGGGEELRAVCRSAGDVSLAELAAVPAAGVWVGEFAGHDAEAATTVTAVSAGLPPRNDAALAAELSARSGAPIVDALPLRRAGAPIEHREDRAPPFYVAAALLLAVEAALRRGVKG